MVTIGQSILISTKLDMVIGMVENILKLSLVSLMDHRSLCICKHSIFHESFHSMNEFCEFHKIVFEWKKSACTRKLIT